MPPSSMKALKSVSEGKAELQTTHLPKLRDDYILVKVKAVGLNPTDWKHIDWVATPGATLGCDYAGVVEQVGSKVRKPFVPGDRIAGFTHGCHRMNLEDGSFAEWAMVKGDVAMKVPDNVSDEEAATLGIGISTVGQALYQTLGLPLPGSEERKEGDGGWLLVWGGSTATGSLAIQFGVLSWYKVLTSCSPHNFEFVKKLGATHAFDRNNPDEILSRKIKEYTNDGLTLAFDTVCEDSTAELCANAVSSKGGRIALLGPAEYSRKDEVRGKYTLAYTIKGEDMDCFGDHMAAVPEDFEFAKKFWQLSTELLASEKITVHPPQVGEGGLKGVLEGLELLRQEKVSGKKLVYRIEETP